MQCGAKSSEHARFCWSCGTALDPAPEADRDIRKTVTILFCDLVGSTALGEQRDPEQVRHVISRYFETVAATLRVFGGTVEKFIGDAVMAVFGMPVLREDDAIRALLAADQIRRSMDALNAELAHTLGTPLQVRLGINSGEVVARESRRGDFMVTGDTVNAAERLERSAEPGEIVMGSETYRLSQHAIRVELLGDVAVKGRAGAVTAYRLLEILASTSSRPPMLRSPLIGRETERLLLESALSRCIRDRSSQLFTLLGQPGVGKSRLVAETLEPLGDGARVLVVSCVRYGDVASFWPVVELVKQALGLGNETSEDKIRASLAALLASEPEAELITGRLLEILGVTDTAPVGEESFWAVRRLFEVLAGERPLVVVLDDVNRADARSLDLVEDLTNWSRDAPILLICLGRPELVAERPTWGANKLNSTTLFIEPLADSESERLMDNLLANLPIATRLRDRIVEVTGGNPLFIEEMLTRLIDDGALFRRDDGWELRDADADLPLPTTVNVLLQSRLDALEPDQRRLLEEASIEGKVFHRGAVKALASPGRRERVDDCLAVLVQLELIRHDQPAFKDETAYRFRHLLIRDVAYESIPKVTRAGLHETFARWMDWSSEGRRGEYDEIVGHHLEQAFQYRREFERVDTAMRGLAGQAGDRLAGAGRRALSRGDANSAIDLLRRSADLFEAGPGRSPEVLLDLGSALSESGDFQAAEEVLEAALDDARASGRRPLEARVRIELSFQRVLVDSGANVTEMLAVAKDAIEVFEQVGDFHGLSRARSHIAQVHWTRCRCSEMEEVLEQALRDAERAGALRERSRILRDLARATVIGPRPVDMGISRCHRILLLADDDLTTAAVVEAMIAVLEAMRRDFDTAREHWARSRRRLEDLGLSVTLAGLQMYCAFVELMAGDPKAAEAAAAEAYAVLERVGERRRLPTTAALLARAIFAQGRYEEAERYSRITEEAASKDDFVSQVMWRGTRSKVLARTGELRHAEELARSGVALAGETDFLLLHADALTDLADVMSVLRRPEEAAGYVDEAIELYELKGIRVGADAARDLRRALPAAAEVDGGGAQRI